MLLRNLDLRKRLCNGTRIVVWHCNISTLDCEVLCGLSAGKHILLPHVQLATADTALTFVLQRRQFPTRLAHSMTINKSQGQTFEKVGLHMKLPCFSHGQLHVAFSRAISFDNIFVQVCSTDNQGFVGDRCFTGSIVYSQVLN